MSKRGHEEEAVMNPAAQDQMKEKHTGVDRHGWKVIWSGAIGMALQLAILLASAGRLWWMQAWVLTAFHSFFIALHILVLVKVNPGLLNERGFYIGCHQYLGERELAYVVARIREYFDGQQQAAGC